MNITYPEKRTENHPVFEKLRRMAQQPESRPLRLARARPEFAALGQEEVLRALEDAGSAVRQEVERLVTLYAPRLAAPARRLRPAGMLRLDVRTPVEKVAADLAFKAVAPGARRPL